MNKNKWTKCTKEQTNYQTKRDESIETRINTINERTKDQMNKQKQTNEEQKRSKVTEE